MSERNGELLSAIKTAGEAALRLYAENERLCQRAAEAVEARQRMEQKAAQVETHVQANVRLEARLAEAEEANRLCNKHHWEMVDRIAGLESRLAEAERERDWYKGLHDDHCAMSCDDTPPWKRATDSASLTQEQGNGLD